MEFKVGQKVKVKQLIGNSYCEVTNLYISEDMTKYSGKTTIVSVFDNYDDTMQLKDCGYSWFSKHMLTPIKKSRIKRK